MAGVLAVVRVPARLPRLEDATVHCGVHDRQLRPASASDAMSASVSRRRFLAGLGATAGAIGLLGADPVSASASTRQAKRRAPNVLYVTADDLGTRLHAYGHPIVSTPRIDAFARDALLFERAYCQIAICGASRTSILTGLRPETTGVLGDDEQWREHARGAVTLPRHFRDHGYRTYAIGKINDPRNGKLDDAWIEQPQEWGIHNTIGARKLMRKVAAGDDSRPFFLAIGFTAPHCPWAPTRQSLARYRGVDVLREAGPGHRVQGDFLKMCTPQTIPEASGAKRFRLSDAQVADIVRRYLASVTDVDTMFGEILDSARHLGMLDDTIVIFWSGDHGFSLGDSGQWGKWTNYASATRIPLIMSVPGMQSAGASRARYRRGGRHVPDPRGAVRSHSPASGPGRDLLRTALRHSEPVVEEGGVHPLGEG